MNLLRIQGRILMAELAGKSVLITGAAAGVGYHLAKQLGQAGCRLILIDQNEEGLSKVAEELTKTGVQVGTYTADVTDKPRVETIAAEIIETCSGLDLLINNAGVGLHKELAETSREDWEKLMNVNMWGSLNFVYAFLPSMKEMQRGHIVNISSGQAFFRLPTWGAYAAVKTCVSVFSEVLHFELRKYRIKVTTVYPFMVNTGFYDQVQSETYWSRKSMELLPYYSQSPERTARIIFRAIRKGKRVCMGSIFNRVGRLILSCPPLAYLTSRIVSWAMTKRISQRNQDS